ncbi:glycosyltransferase family 2 protein, partial [Escherichia coli]|nr:glycosyltransferase family 2 protein [Escherichia coli]
MKISIVSPAYNAEKFIMRVFNNLQPLLGTYIHKWIIVDDCSIDETEKIISKLALQHESVEYLRLEKNSGPAEARYKGIEKVKTDIF